MRQKWKKTVKINQTTYVYTFKSTHTCFRLYFESLQVLILATYPINHPQGLKSIFCISLSRSFYSRRAYISDSMTIWTTQHNTKSLLMLRIRTLCPIPDHFWHYGPDPDQVRDSGPYRSHCISALRVLLYFSYLENSQDAFPDLIISFYNVS